jgi:hypothetical protein
VGLHVKGGMPLAEACIVAKRAACVTPMVESAQPVTLCISLLGIDVFDVLQ